MARAASSSLLGEQAGVRALPARRLVPPRLRRSINGAVLLVVGTGVGLGLWAAVSQSMDAAVMPGPVATFEHIRDNLFGSEYLEAKGLSQGGGYIPHLWYTARNVLMGVAIGTTLGAGVGLVSLRSKVLKEVADSVAAVFGTAPIFVAAPFFLIWFGIVPSAQILIVAFYTALLMYVFSRRAGENIPSTLVESALTLGAGRWTILRRIHLPGSIPELTGGLRIALAGAWGLAGIAELLGAQQGAGFLIKFFSTAFLIDGMLAIIVLLGFVAIAFDLIVVAVSRSVIRWTDVQSST